MASTPVGSNALILEVLNRHNYKNWRSRVKTYLLAEDLWEVIIQAMTEPAKHDDEYKAWAKKNAKALYAIQNSCGPEMFPFIRETETAKSAWEALERVSKLTGHVENSAEYFKPYIPFTQFVRAGDWVKAKECVRLGELDLHSAVRAIDPRGGFGDMALHVAARKGHVHIVKELVTLMTLEELKMKNAKGSTALHVAAGNRQVHTVKELVLLMGEEKNGNGDTALHLAVHEGFVDTVKLLVLFMRQEDLKIKNSKGYTALHLAVFKGNVSIVKELGPLMGEVRDGVGDTALHIAVKMEQLEIVKELVLLMRREDLAIKNNEGYTALHLAVNKGNVPIVKQFVTKKEGEDDFDRYILFTACVINGDCDKVKECLSQLDDPYDAITRVDPRDGCTALHVAALQGHERIVEELVSLLKVRQVLEPETVQDFTAFGSGINLGVSEQVVMEKAKYIVEQYEKTITSVLEVQYAKGFTALHLAVLKGNIDIVKELVLLMRPEGLEIKDVNGDSPLHLAVANENVDIVKMLVPLMRVKGLEAKNYKGSNALHIAAMNGHMHIVKELMPLMRKEALEEKDGEGYTALGRALKVCKDEDVKEMAKYMAENNNKVFGINTPPRNWIPVVTANPKSWDLCRYLYPLTPLEFLKPEHGTDGAQLIIDCLRAKELDMALDLLQRCPILAISPTAENNDIPPIMELPGMHSAFLSGTQLGFWQKLIYNRMHIEPANLNINATYVIISKQEDDRHNRMDLTHSVIRLYKELINGLLKLLGVNELRKMKWIHTRSTDILHFISEMVKKGNLTSTELDIVKTSIFKAVEHGHVEFVTHMCQAHPPFVLSENESEKNIFHFAVECRQNKIYSLIYGFDKEFQRFFGSREVKYSENMLHVAGSLSPLSRFNCIRGATLQMQRELQWFKEVEKIVPLEKHEILNLEGMTPHELFTKNHENLKVEAENSMKGTATSCTVVGALIVTIMFTATFTVPGGNNDNTGAPMFIAKKLFLAFIISDTLSLVFSTTSVIVFLEILTSRYAEDDFLTNLPTKMLIGLFTLFLSIATMMIAFSSALIIMLREEHSWAIAPSIVVACIPVGSFIWLQFPLLIETFMSTYGSRIFDKKVKPWVQF
ncbi:hypothetical protein M0R45_027472 [Rubus argutus]|uniref:PGG domain-containing protein n=1 Tax=Rubus argutus TaxID=59490 RepID=A0AAW1X4C4_RUBAR